MSPTTTKEISIGDVAAREAAGISRMDGEDRMALNVGPSHPTTHGVLRLILELNGDFLGITCNLYDIPNLDVTWFFDTAANSTSPIIFKFSSKSKVLFVH